MAQNFSSSAVWDIKSDGKMPEMVLAVFADADRHTEAVGAAVA